MAERLKSYVFQRGGTHGESSKYDNLLDGGIWRVSTTEFSVKTVNVLLQGIYAAARRNSVKIRYKKESETTIVMQTYSEDGRPLPKPKLWHAKGVQKKKNRGDDNDHANNNLEGRGHGQVGLDEIGDHPKDGEVQDEH